MFCFQYFLIFLKRHFFNFGKTEHKFNLKGFKSWTTKLSYDLAFIQHLMDKYGIKKEML